MALRRPAIVACLLIVGAVGAWWGSGRWGPSPAPDRVLDRAEQAARVGDRGAIRRALAGWREPVALTDDDRFRLARLRLAGGLIDQAIADFDRVDASSPRAAEARLLAGQLELRRMRLRPAERRLRAALALDPTATAARRNLMLILGYQGRHPEIAAEFGRAAAFHPFSSRDLMLWSHGPGIALKAEEVAEFLEAALRADPGDRRSRLALADSLRRLNRPAEARRLLDDLPADDPDARAARARLAVEGGELAEARRLLADGPADHLELARLRGQVALGSGDAAAAVEHFRAALAADPDHRATLQGLARALQLAGRDPEAEATRGRLERLDRLHRLLDGPDPLRPIVDPELVLQLARAHEEAGDPLRALGWYRYLISLDPLHAEAQRAAFRLAPAADPPD